MSELADLIAEHRRRDAADLDREIGKAEREHAEDRQHVCRFCGQRWWSSHIRGRAVIASYLPAAGCVAHTACWSYYTQQGQR